MEGDSGSDSDFGFKSRKSASDDSDSESKSNASPNKSAARKSEEKSGSEASGSEDKSNNKGSDSEVDKSGSEQDKSGNGSDSEPEKGSDSEDEKSNKSGSEDGSSSSESGSDSGSGSGDDLPPSPPKSKRERIADIKDAYEENPDVYGIRRSGRERKEPERLAPKKEPLAAKVKRRSSSSAVWGSSDSDSDVPAPRSRRPGGGGGGSGAARGARPAPRKKKRRLSDSSDSGSESDGGGRVLSRRGGSRINYQEQQDEATDEEDLVELDEATIQAAAEAENAETVERVLKHRVGKVGATGPGTTVYSVEENGDPNTDFDADDDAQQHETQYWLKWKGWSHLHNTWESEATLKSQGYYGLQVKGMKKIENYNKRQAEIKAYLALCGPEEAEYFVCQTEMQSDLDNSYLEVDRIIGEGPKPGHEYPDYLVKWCNLPYSECTWEDGALIAKKYEHRIDEFIRRSQSRKTPVKVHAVLKRRPKFVNFTTQPDFLSGDSGELRLRDYQLDGINWLVHSWCRGNSVILADEMGLGKTIQTTCFLYYLFNQHQLYGPYLVVVPLSTLPAWQRELERWAPEMNVVTYLGDVSSREKIRAYECCFPGNKRLKFNVLLTSYEILLKDKSFLGAIAWAALLVDEAHRLKNEESLLYKTLFDFNTNHRLLITGTPLQNSLKELWSLLHFIMPQRFDRWDNFEVDMDAGSKAYARLHKLLEPFLLRRVKKDVEKSLPAKVEQILRVGMTGMQRQYYKWLLTRNYTMLKRGLKAPAPSLVNLIMELKKCCNHGYLTKPPEYDATLAANERLQALLRGSGKLMLLDKLLVRLKERGNRVLIFSQMVMMLDILGEYLQLRQFPFQRLDGGMRGDLRKQALDHFNADGSMDFCFLLSTRAGGLGINLATADTVVIYDSDWNPQNDLQAQSRAHRIGQKNQVNIYRLVTMQSIEEEIIERAKRKMVLDHLVIQSMDSTGRTVLKKGASSSTTPFNKDELNAILKFGAEELFNKDDDEEDDDHAVCDIDLILQRAETREEEPVNAPANDLLSAFKVASFQVDEDDVASLSAPPTTMSEDSKAANDDAAKDWDDIIPSDMRTKMEEEEKRREMEDLYLPPRSRKTVQAAAAEEEAAREERERKRKRNRLDGDDDDDDDAESDSETARKRPRKGRADRVKGFSNDEVRRFFKAFRRFGCPLERLEAISTEAELQDKATGDLRRLGETILSQCREALDEQQKSKDNNGTAAAAATGDVENGDAGKTPTGRKKRETGPSFKLSGVSINAKTTLQTIEDLEPLHRAMPTDAKQRRHWVLQPPNGRVKEVHWDVGWAIEEDSRLLQGVYEYGTGAWESIKIDPTLRLEDKILLEQADSKPQAKHLQARTDYLIKILRKTQLQQGAAHTPAKRGGRGSRGGKATVPRNKKAVSREIIEDDLSSDDNARTAQAAKDVKKEPDHQPKEGEGKKEQHKKEGDEKKEKKHRKKKKEQMGPMHFTANHEPVQVSSTEELPESVFLECKEKMRPVKRALKALDSPDPSLTDLEQVNHTRQCLIQIGTHIDKCLQEFHAPERIKEWRSNLWYFVSKFTEFDPRKLYKLYKHAVKKQGSSHHAGDDKEDHTGGSKDNKDHQRDDKDKEHHKHKSKKKRRESAEGGASAEKTERREERGGASGPAAAAAGRKSEERRRDDSHSSHPAHRHDDDERDRSYRAGDRSRHERDDRSMDRGGGGGARANNSGATGDPRHRDWPARHGYGGASGGGHGNHGSPASHHQQRDYYDRGHRDRSWDRDRDYRGGGGGDRHYPAPGGGYWSSSGRPQSSRPPGGYDQRGYGSGGYGGQGYGGGYNRGYGGYGREDRWGEHRRDDGRGREDRRPPPSASSATGAPPGS